MIKVCKFGGSSVKDAIQIKKVIEIIKEDKKRKVIVVSAPGRDEKFNEKITDHLLNIATNGNHFFEQQIEISKEDSLNVTIQKYENLCDDLSIKKEIIISSLKSELENKSLKNEERNAFFLSRGEHYNAKIISMYMNQIGIKTKLMLPEDFGFILSDDFTDGKVQEISHENIRNSFDLNKEERYLVPGFYGINEDKKIVVMSRGGSDLTGGELAYGLDVDIYENWTDTNVYRK